MIPIPWLLTKRCQSGYTPLQVMAILKALIMESLGTVLGQDLSIITTSLALLLIQEILKMLLYLHRIQPGKHILLKLPSHLFIEDLHRRRIRAVVKSGNQLQMVFLNQVEQLFPYSQQIQRLQESSMLSTTVEYSTLLIWVVHGKCLMAYNGLRSIFHNILSL